MCSQSFLRFTLPALAGLALVVSGCATYHGPSAKADNVATLEAIVPAWVTSVDGGKVMAGLGGNNQRVRLAPGVHRIEVRYSALTERTVVDQRGRPHHVKGFVQSRGSCMLSLTAESGHTYYLHDGQVGATWKPFIDESVAPVFVDFK